MSLIIGIAGKKRSGKNTLANYLHGYLLQLNEVIREFNITENGELSVNTSYIKDGHIKDDVGILDLSRQDDLFVQYASNQIWPFVKLYHFADPLKEICCSILGLDPESVYGSDKNKKTHLLWENMPTHRYDKQYFGRNGNMSAREVMQYFGTEIFRQAYPDVWKDILINRVVSDSSLVAIVADCRFDNEATAIKNNGGIIIRCNREVEPDTHSSETGVSDNLVDFELPDNNVDTCCKAALDFLVSSGYSQFINRAE